MASTVHGLFATFIYLSLLVSECVLKEAELLISPALPVQTKAVGHNVVLTCQPDVDNRQLISELKWFDPRGAVIDENYFERQRISTEMIEERALALIINSFQEKDAGEYICVLNYAVNVKLRKSVRLESIHPIKFVDAPETQNPIINTSYKIRCKVSASPGPHLDWMKNGDPVRPGGRLVIQQDGLLIPEVTEADDGVYTCRAVVIKTGELAVRNIKVEVHTPPTINITNSTVEVEAGTAASVLCSAYGKPAPTFSWTRKDNNAIVAKMPRFGVNSVTGMMTINPVEEVDHGEYKCVASNAAAKVERVVKVTVIMRPRIADMVNVTMVVGERENRFNCVARGRPPPTIAFKKYGATESMLVGQQLYNTRAYVENRPTLQKPEEVTGTLIIRDVQRADDGLYECIASNKAGDTFRTGHIQVQFPPSFDNTPMKAEMFTWERQPINLTCIAESIPNATINWYLNDMLVEEHPWVRKFGNGPISTLQISPQQSPYTYGVYKCAARNIHGDRNHTILLKEARRPGLITHVGLLQTTATTIKFQLKGPSDNGGIPVTHYAVQYVDDSNLNWNQAIEKTWVAGSTYVLESLYPERTYHFRFAAVNKVGVGAWGLAQYHTLPRKSVPTDPQILLTDMQSDGALHSPYDTRFELRWQIPADNGEPIDYYILLLNKVRRVSGYNWEDDGVPTEEKIRVSELKGTSYVITKLHPDSYYKIQLKAHNYVGLSPPGMAYFKTARGVDKATLVATSSSGLPLTSGAIVGIVVASLLIILLIIDVSCFVVNRAGLLFLMCGEKDKTPHEENKLASEEKEPLRENGRHKIEVMDDRLKKDTRITYDDRNATVRTAFIGKDSAV